MSTSKLQNIKHLILDFYEDYNIYYPEELVNFILKKIKSQQPDLFEEKDEKLLSSAIAGLTYKLINFDSRDLNDKKIYELIAHYYNLPVFDVEDLAIRFENLLELHKFIEKANSVLDQNEKSFFYFIPEDFMDFKMSKKIGAAEHYYAKLGNEIIDSIQHLSLEGSALKPVILRTFIMMSIFYLNDLITGTKFFDTIRRISMQLYNKPLPVLDISDDYVWDDVNEEDIKFLLILTVNYMLSPYGKFWAYEEEKELADEISHIVFSRLYEAYEYFYENPSYINSLKQIDFHKLSIFELFEAVLDFVANNYLLTLNFKQFKDLFEELFDKKPFADLSDQVHFNSMKNIYIINQSLAAYNYMLFGYNVFRHFGQYLKTLYGRDFDYIENVKSIFSLFEVIDIDKQNYVVTLKTVDTNEIYKVNFFNMQTLSLLESSKYIKIKIIFYKDTWFFSGIIEDSTSYELSEEEKYNSTVYEIGFEHIREKYVFLKKAFLQLTNGEEFYVLPSSELTSFVQRLDQLATEISGGKYEYKSLLDNIHIKSDTPRQNTVLFVSKFSGLIIGDSFLPLIQLTDSFDEINMLTQQMFSRSILPPDFVETYIMHYKDKNPAFETNKFQSVLKNLDFWMRFFHFMYY